LIVFDDANPALPYVQSLTLQRKYTSHPPPDVFPTGAAKIGLSQLWPFRNGIVVLNNTATTVPFDAHSDKRINDGLRGNLPRELRTPGAQFRAEGSRIALSSANPTS
jgi:hypothetical protein